MMSILLLTLLSWLHCQPPLPIPRMSLLPVANVESSWVQKDVEVELRFAGVSQPPDSKSRLKAAAANGLPLPMSVGLFATVSVEPLTLWVKSPFVFGLAGVETFPAVLAPQS